MSKASFSAFFFRLMIIADFNSESDISKSRNEMNDNIAMNNNATVNDAKEGANKRGNSSRLTQSFHFFMFEPIFSPVNALNQPI